MARLGALGRLRRCFAPRAIYARRAALAVCLLACGAALYAPPPAAAFSLFGKHLWGKKQPADDIIGEPKHYTVEFAPLNVAAAKSGGPAAGAARPDAKAEKADEKIARKASALYAGRKKAVAGSGGVLARARGDYARILAAFYAAGRYGPLISITVNGQEAANIPYGAELPADSKIVIRVKGGQVYHFHDAAVKTEGAADKADAAAVAARLRADAKKTGYIKGATAESGKVFSMEDQAIQEWRGRGYAKAGIADRQVAADHAAAAADAQITAAPGRKAWFGPLSVKNVSAKPRMNSHYVAWLTGLHEGELYSPQALATANARLSKLDAFRSANLEEADKIGVEGRLPMTLTLQEKPLHRIGGGVSYSTIDGGGVSGYWMHRNLWGHGEKLRLDAGISNIMGSRNSSSTDPSDYTYSVGGSFIRPGIITPDTDYVASLNGQREVLDNYTTKNGSFSNGFNHKFSNTLSGYLYANAARIQVDDDTWGRRNFTILGLQSGLTFDNRDNAADARRGFYGELMEQPFYEAEYGNIANKITAEGRTYISMGEHSPVLALRGKIGSITGAPISQLPSNMLFFIGGGGSVRGYAYRSIGIYKKNGDVIGGRSMAEGSAELRTMVSNSFGVVAFADAGLVGQDSTPDFDQDAKLGAGLGLRYKTGMGALRLDVAMPLNREKGDSRYGLYIGIGQAF